ncbi:MAG: GTP cyclohydrolase I, partial [Gemmatimonadaceae bacterium]
MRTKVQHPKESDIAESRDSQLVENPGLESVVHRQLEMLGEDPEREGLLDTPRRVARSLRWLTQGYRTCVEDVVGTGVFKAEGHKNMVMVRDIEL